jgi:predicted glycosyltransferase
MLVSDGQTMTIEAAVLGTPAIRFNTFVGLCSVIEELEGKYELTYGFKPTQEEAMFAKIESLLKRNDLKKEWALRREKMLAEKIDLTEWTVNLLENYRDISRDRKNQYKST